MPTLEKPTVQCELHYQRTFQVAVEAAPESKIYTLHEDIFLSRSTFLRAARSQHWATDETITDLTDEKPKIFEAYLHCIYRDEVNKHYKSNHAHQPLFELYVLADKLEDAKTANVIIDEIVERSKDILIPTATEARYVYTHSVTGSPLRMLLVDLLVHEWDGVAEKSRIFPKQLLLDAMSEYARIQVECAEAEVVAAFTTTLQEQDYGRYHVHNGEYPASDCSTECVYNTEEDSAESMEES
ncbi:hypothetical protein B0A48_00083 [Cryoendolithus antarcticus]|uniref:Uncharacterized protein n=1 Tax=Cryoendolithus antarcticus TaxID=1507870 RepID=A0A1V8TU44_9PEZI|nr:hypothetical protein B0A48_00083 [Cryoendolithus antarcticus]